MFSQQMGWFVDKGIDFHPYGKKIKPHKLTKWWLMIEY